MSKFNVNFDSTANDLINKIGNELRKKKGSLEGDDATGEFEIASPVTIKGKYKIDGQKIEIEITKKPMFVTAGMVEDAVSKEFEKIDKLDDRIAGS